MRGAKTRDDGFQDDVTFAGYGENFSVIEVTGAIEDAGRQFAEGGEENLRFSQNAAFRDMQVDRHCNADFGLNKTKLPDVAGMRNASKIWYEPERGGQCGPDGFPIGSVEGKVAGRDFQRSAPYVVEVGANGHINLVTFRGINVQP